MAFERGVILGPKYSRYEPSTGVGFTIDPNGDPALIRHAVLLLRQNPLGAERAP